MWQEFGLLCGVAFNVFLFHVNPPSVKFTTSLTVQDFEPYVESTQSEPCSEQKCGAHLHPNHRPRINDQTQSIDFITYLENVKEKESESPPQVLVRCMPETSLALWVDGCETPRCLANCDQKCGILLVHHFLGATSLKRYTNGDVCIPSLVLPLWISQQAKPSLITLFPLCSSQSSMVVCCSFFPVLCIHSILFHLQCFSQDSTSLCQVQYDANDGETWHVARHQVIAGGNGSTDADACFGHCGG